MDSRHAGEPTFTFLHTEVQTGLAFAKIALSTDAADRDKIERNTGNARAAYDAVLRFRERAQLNEAMAKELHVGLKKLKELLIQLGQVI